MIHGCVYQQTRFTRRSQLLRKPNGHMTINKPKSTLLSVLFVLLLYNIVLVLVVAQREGKGTNVQQGEVEEGGDLLGRCLCPTNINKCMELDTCFKCHFLGPCIHHTRPNNRGLLQDYISIFSLKL